MITDEIIKNPIGCKVEIQWLDGEIQTFEIVDNSTDGDGDNKISFDTDFAKSLLNHKQGDTVKYRSAKQECIYTILSVQIVKEQNVYI
ncbi:MAG: GreA/GreB family elongation factor, partial [Clostridia bacterium]|nr:GreA/GreB family elongation factor [Clostridia bacterium]